MPMSPEEQKTFDEMKATNEKIAQELDALKSKPAPDPAKPDLEEDLVDKARKKQTSDAEHTAQVKRIENATRFTLGMEKFLSDHLKILPAGVPEIVKAAEKENYDTTEMKANATKAAIVKAFFSVQDNVDLLTPTQKNFLDDFLKLTKTGREEKAPDIYENIFEPTLEMIKRVKKAEEIGRANSGFGVETDISTGYKARLIARSRHIHLGEKEG